MGLLSRQNRWGQALVVAGFLAPNQTRTQIGDLMLWGRPRLSDRAVPLLGAAAALLGHDVDRWISMALGATLGTVVLLVVVSVQGSERWRG